MHPGDFARITNGFYRGMTGTLVGLCIGDESSWWVRLTATGQHVRVSARWLRHEQRTSEQAKGQAA